MSYNMDKRDLPDIYVCPSPGAKGLRVWAYISGKYTTKVYTTSEKSKKVLNPQLKLYSLARL